MPKPNPQLEQFIALYPGQIQDLFRQVRDFVISQSPQVNDLIWDNYNEVALAYSRSRQLKDAFYHLAIYFKHVNLGFNRGAELASQRLKLQGKSKITRHVSAVVSIDKILIKEKSPLKSKKLNEKQAQDALNYLNSVRRFSIF